jgi:hypothetical protein
VTAVTANAPNAKAFKWYNRHISPDDNTDAAHLTIEAHTPISRIHVIKRKTPEPLKPFRASISESKTSEIEAGSCFTLQAVAARTVGHKHVLASLCCNLRLNVCRYGLMFQGQPVFVA